ncbi:MAG: PAS domain S-box protein, partial [Actinomycetota bacterium]
RRALEEQRTIDVEYSLRIEGREVWFSAAVSPALADTVVWVARDITERKEAERRLKESEERFRALVQNAPDVIALLDENGVIVYESPAVERVLGYGPSERVGGGYLDHVHPEDRERVKSTLEETLSGASISFEFRLRSRDGSWRRVEAVGTNLLADPAVEAVVVNYRDVTERRRAEERLKESEERYRRQARELALLHQVRTALSAELDLRGVLRAAVEVTAEAYGYTLVGAYLVEDGHLVLQHYVGYDNVLRRIPLDRGVMARSVRERRPVFLEDVGADPEFIGAVEGVVSEICIPILDGDEAVGCLNVESTAGMRLAPYDLRLMVAVGEHLSDAVSRARLFTRAQESERRYRDLVERVPAVSYVLEHDRDAATSAMAGGSVTYISPQVETILGYPPAVFIEDGGFWVSKIHPDDRKSVLAEDARTDSTGEPFDLEYRMLHSDGRWVWIRDEAVLLPGESERILRWHGILFDVTELKETERALKEAETRYRTLVENIPAITYVQEVRGERSVSTYISPQ